MNNFLSWFKEFFFGIEAKIEEEVKKVEEEVKTTKRKVKEKLDVNKDGKINLDDASAAIKKGRKKKT